MRPICCECREQMLCSKTGKQIIIRKYSETTLVVSGDEFECKSCGKKVVIGFGNMHAVKKEQEKTDAVVLKP